MTYRMLTPDLAVAPQIAPEDIPALRADGFTTILCNRPDGEVPPPLQAAALRAVAEENGLRFVENPVVHSALTEEVVAAQGEAIAEGGKVLAYCASGTRSTIVWMLGQAESTPADTLLAAASAAGYQLDGMRPQLDGLFKG